MPGQQRQIQGFGDLLGQQGFTGARLTLDQQRSFERDRGINRHLQIIGGNVFVGTLKLHVVLQKIRYMAAHPDPPGHFNKAIPDGKVKT